MNTVYDIIGIGIGPFNLGMAAMCEKMPLNCIFFDQNPEFEWHPGMMLPNSRLQVPFYADLVTVVDPTSKYTFLNYLKEKQRLFRFTIHENNYITRKEYNDYCRWVVEDLDSLKFNHKVIDVRRDSTSEHYAVDVHNQTSRTTESYKCRNIVIGVGSVPWTPCSLPAAPEEPQADCNGPLIFHSSKYLNYKHCITPGKRVTIIGSGQSAAEIFMDLLNESEKLLHLSWYTRSSRFYPMEYSKLTLEMTSPDYIDHFFSLNKQKKKEVITKQQMLYKGINFSLINEIYDTLYSKDLNGPISNITLQANMELQHSETLDDIMYLTFRHIELNRVFSDTVDVLVLATGYQNCNPSFLNGVIDHIKFDGDGSFEVQRNYSVDNNDSIFVQNAELHTHGFSAPDLGLAPYRNASILNTILQYEHYTLERKVAFQNFGLIYSS